MDKDLVQLDRETKQNYLRENIIDGGYDPNIFQEYMNDLKPGGFAYLMNFQIFNLYSHHRWLKR